MNTQSEDPLSFEQAYARLEQILDKMNGSKASLDESLKLYEEADQLIHFCTERLTQAEQKIEVLMKNKNGTLALDDQMKPQTQHFPSTRQNGAPKQA